MSEKKRVERRKMELKCHIYCRNNFGIYKGFIIANPKINYTLKYLTDYSKNCIPFIPNTSTKNSNAAEILSFHLSTQLLLQHEGNEK